jgi:L-lactate dehydrogenase (cytochrome)
MKYAGGDATAAYDQVHAPAIIEKGLSMEKCVGVIDPATLPRLELKPVELVAQVQSPKPPLQSLISVHDFEEVARNNYTAKAFAFYSSAATDLVSHRANLRCHRQVLLRPRVLRNVKSVSTQREIVGCLSSAPFFVSPTAMARLAHADGELALAKACGRADIIMGVG